MIVVSLPATLPLAKWQPLPPSQSIALAKIGLAKKRTAVRVARMKVEKCGMRDVRLLSKKVANFFERMIGRVVMVCLVWKASLMLC